MCSLSCKYLFRAYKLEKCAYLFGTKRKQCLDSVMPELQEIKRTMSRIEKLEREVNLKQLQINSLLAITQAINENVTAEGLFSMYNSFLRWEIGISKMALFFTDSGQWECKTFLGIEEALLQHDVTHELSRYRSKQGLNNSEHPLIREFDLVIPVMHKDVAIAYAFIGGFQDNDDVYNKVQFITTITNVIAVAIENKRLFKHQLRQEVVNRYGPPVAAPVTPQPIPPTTGGRFVDVLVKDESGTVWSGRLTPKASQNLEF